MSTRSLIPEMSTRFIPISSSSKVYKSSDNMVQNELSPSLSPPALLSLREDFLFSGIDNHSSSFSSDTSGDVANSSSIFSASTPVSTRGGTPISPNDAHHDTVAAALEFKKGSKVLTFNSTKSPTKRHLDSVDYSLFAEPHDFPKNKIKKTEPIKTTMATDILQAPGLRNDYYSNLVSWSPKTNKVAVGLGSKVYLWGVDNNVISVNYENSNTSGTNTNNSGEIVTAIACSSEDWILVATAGGKILLVDQKKNQVVTEYRIKNNKCVFCITWFPDSLNFIAGDDYGDVYFFKIIERDVIDLVLEKQFKCHQQHICGLALISTNDELAVGANDNCCTIWDIQDIYNPVLKFVLPHNAAIKALSYCPWTQSLLATGGGSKDRKIRFWHTSTGTLLNEYYTDGQITSLNWSHYSKEIVATFGFGGGGGHRSISRNRNGNTTSGTTTSNNNQQSTLLCVYSYPAMIPKVEVTAAYNLRILSSTMSPDNCSICVATNDSTIRIYPLWKKSIELSTNHDSSRNIGDYGSSIIELVEGITKGSDPIR
ncbi:Meiosis-specific APC/C activator protein AMA1 [Spathaspora sp. JA1]|nr:Meiosis-specific APC/C activator protein AMA1 [Spathaspora sp. JA1]